MPMRQEVRPNIDIAGSIGGLGDALQQGMEFGQKRRVDKATRAALAQGLTTGPDGLPDYMTAAGNILAGGGDTDTALTLARLAEAQNQRLWQQNQPDWQVVNGSLYNLRNLGGQPRGAPTQPQAGPQGPGPAEPDYQQPPDQPDYQPPDQPAPDQTAQAEPQPIIRGPKKPPQRRTDIDAEGNVVTTEAGEDGVWRVVSGPKKATPKARSLSNATTNDLIEAGQNAQDINRLQATWSDNYAGYGVGGEVANTAGKLLPGSKYADQARWWQDYQTRKNDLRHSKFGASLTPGEKSEFAKADIDPNMQPPVIRANLDRQQKILTNAAKRLAKVWIKQGYNADAIAEAVGFTPEELGIQPQADTEAPVPGSAENAASEEPTPDQSASPTPDEAAPQQAEQPQQEGQIVEMSDGRRFRLMPDGTVIQLD
jgi:hypothetical protein